MRRPEFLVLVVLVTTIGCLFFGIQNVSAQVNWITPTGHSDPQGTWSQETNLYDDKPPGAPNTSAFGYTPAGRCSTDWIIVTLTSPISADRMRFYNEWSAEPGDPGQMLTGIDIDVYNNDTGLWEEVVYGEPFPAYTWVEEMFPSGTINTSQLRMRLTKLSIYCTTDMDIPLTEVDFGEAPLQPCGACIPAECGFVALRPEGDQKLAYTSNNALADQIFLDSTTQAILTTQIIGNSVNLASLVTKSKSILLKIRLIFASIIEKPRELFLNIYLPLLDLLKNKKAKRAKNFHSSF